MTTWRNKAVLFVVITLTVCISCTLSCTCQMRHPQQHVCDADFVIKGTVLGRSTLSNRSSASFAGQYEYHVQVHRVFKGQAHDGIGRQVELVTPASEALCGIPKLIETKSYVITGKVRGGEMQVSVCDWVAEWESVTRSQRQGIKHIYQKYCSSCMIRMSSPAQISNPLPAGPLDYFQGCSYSSYAPLRRGMDDCEAMYSSCVQHQHGGCRWLDNHGYQECVENREIEMQLQMETQKFGYNSFNAINQGGNW